jgi:hypothetical protein
MKAESLKTTALSDDMRRLQPFCHTTPQLKGFPARKNPAEA